MAETEKYVPQAQVVRPAGILRVGNLARIKAYTMVSEETGGQMPLEEYAAIAYHVEKEIAEGRVNPHLGLGFLVASEGIANLALWGGKFPSLMNQTVYSFDSKIVAQKPDFKRELLDEAGTFCCYEGAIVGHESLAWRRYLFSPQEEGDKRGYLKDTFTGRVGRNHSES